MTPPPIPRRPLTIPATLAGEVLLRPIIKLVFEGRAFTPENSELVILAARMFLIGLSGHCLVEVAARLVAAQGLLRIEGEWAEPTAGLMNQGDRFETARRQALEDLEKKHAFERG